VKRLRTDFELLREIYDRHRGDFGSYEEAMESRSSKIMVPIDIPAIADRFGVDPDSIFGRLYYHLNPKYGSPRGTSSSSRRKREMTRTASTSLSSRPCWGALGGKK
jgi:hypothetical protein